MGMRENRIVSEGIGLEGWVRKGDLVSILGGNLDMIVQVLVVPPRHQRLVISVQGKYNKHIVCDARRNYQNLNYHIQISSQDGN